MASNHILLIKKPSLKIRIIKIAVPALLVAALVLAVWIKQRSNQAETSDKIDSSTVHNIASFIPNADQYVDKLIAESENYELYLDGVNLSITIKDKNTGATLDSTVQSEDENSSKQWIGFMKSGIVLDTIERANDEGQVDLINNVNQILIEDTENGIHAQVQFPEQGFSFEVFIGLKGDALVVEIPEESIVERKAETYIEAINVFPFLGYSHLGEKAGYMFIPDGNGALIDLNDKEGRLTGGYSEMVFGTDIGFKESETQSLLWGQFQTVNESENIMAPVFGMVHTEDRIGYLGIIEEGLERASIEAYPNGVKVDYNRIYSRFLLRKLYKQPTSESDSGTITQVEQDRTHYNIKVRYQLVNGEHANYTGLAIEYREYLLQEGGLTVRDNSYHTRIDFLGSEREDWLIFKRKVAMTTVDDIRNISRDLKSEGISNILSLYKGWQSGGLNQLPITSYKADSAIGGTSDLTKLIKELKDEGSRLYLYQDALRINPDENNTTFNVVKRVNKRRYEEPTYQQVYENFLFLIPSRTDYYLEKLREEYQKKGVMGISLSGISNTVFSYSYSGNYYSRPDTMETYSSVIATMDREFELILEQPFSYLWKYSDAFIDMPVGTSNYNFIDEEIPFLSMVLKGIVPMYSEYLNYEANKQEFFLQLVEMGIYPSFFITQEESSKLIYTNSSDVYSSEYSIYKSDIIEFSNALKTVNSAVLDAYIIGHERMDNGVTVVSYDNGVKISVNYSNNDQTVDGFTVEARSYKVGEAGD